MIHLSPAAASEISRLQAKQQPNKLFRLAVKSGGCSGWFYDLSFDDQTRKGDRLFQIGTLEVVIDAESCDHVNGLAIDYSEDLMGGGFRFHNPQSVVTCGCGNSFSTTTPSAV
ncbi:MAG TPA: iron-sulfur cluster assembly accessory protein [Trichormus sp. M33_DOE_039]|nr:iron-sulfur cluster assembly accessory protein [Trichormus sp. M33_DOE_039]